MKKITLKFKNLAECQYYVKILRLNTEYSFQYLVKIIYWSNSNYNTNVNQGKYSEFKQITILVVKIPVSFNNALVLPTHV